MTTPYRALFLSHGGGPLPLLGDAGHREMVSCLERIATIIPKPEAIVVVSAHWERPLPTITAGASPQLIYDYQGFPEAAYHIRYPCPGAPALARKIHALLDKAGIASALDQQRGFDHGLFVPLKIMYPQADIPCVQLSLVATLDPTAHLEMGRAIASLLSERVLLVGSGFSFHNMREFFRTGNAESAQLNRAFEAWLQDTCGNPDHSEQERTRRLLHWADAPGARFCHPREEHLLPLHVCQAAAQGPCNQHFELEILGKQSSMYLW